MRLGVLDVEGSMEEMVALAPAVERLGYSRYWIAEHQPQPSPTLLVSMAAGVTDHIRVGTAGVLLHYYPVLRTAHDFHLLERAYSGRIDAGFCGGLVRDAVVEADREGRDLRAVMAAYSERAAQFVRYLRNTPGSAGFDSSLAWAGAPDAPPQIWSLGSGPRSADLAAELGLAYGYPLMFRASVDDPAVVARYRSRCATPYVAIAVAGICAESDAEAERMRARLERSSFSARVVGSPEVCGARLRELAERYAADEIVFADLCPPSARIRCYELLAAELSDVLTE